jgi:hypothetical protein
MKGHAKKTEKIILKGHFPKPKFSYVEYGIKG